VYGPVIEELLFRSLLLHRWAQKWSLKTALFSSALAFAVIHSNPVGSFIFGLLMAVLYLRTRSLWIPITCHGTYNALVVICQTFRIPHPHALFSGFGFVVTASAFLLFLRKYWPDEKMSLPYFDRPTTDELCVT